jgi:alcohol dehydrogenase (quinone), cytochrome c subunit
MPAFGWKLSDAEVADLLTYIRGSFGNQAEPVKPSKVADVRKKMAQGS